MHAARWARPPGAPSHLPSPGTRFSHLQRTRWWRSALQGDLTSSIGGVPQVSSGGTCEDSRPRLGTERPRLSCSKCGQKAVLPGSQSPSYLNWARW